MDRFWTVLVEGTNGGYCHHHETLRAAEGEAAQLVTKLGKRAFVLELVASCIPATPIWEEITHPRMGEVEGWQSGKTQGG